MSTWLRKKYFISWFAFFVDFVKFSFQFPLTTALVHTSVKFMVICRHEGNLQQGWTNLPSPPPYLPPLPPSSPCSPPEDRKNEWSQTSNTSKLWRLQAGVSNRFQKLSVCMSLLQEMHYTRWFQLCTTSGDIIDSNKYLHTLGPRNEFDTHTLSPREVSHLVIAVCVKLHKYRKSVPIGISPVMLWSFESFWSLHILAGLK